MYIFRDGRRTASGRELVASLCSALCRWQLAAEQSAEDLAVLALIAAGELECALLDGANESGVADSATADSPIHHSTKHHPATPDLQTQAAEITDAVAWAFLTGQRGSLSTILQRAGQIRAESTYTVAVQEGFAYYALHPRKVAMLLEGLELGTRVAVLGIRSIGVTLSAVACAALRLRGVECERITARPQGHPYDRKLEATAELERFAGRWHGAEFLIVDEGPGISGSSFLAMAEALQACGIESSRIHLVGSREAAPATLLAENAAVRWPRFQFHRMENAPLPPRQAGESLSGGAWRRHFRCEEHYTPASWTPLEPAKFLAEDERSVFRFEGYGHYGEEIGARAMLLAARGYSPRYLGNHCGFGEYERAEGRMLTLCDRSREMLRYMAEYLAWRAEAFQSEGQAPELEEMLRWNWQAEFDEELRAEEWQLPAVRVALCDGRMMPHEWLLTTAGEMLKLDAVSHGDNHFFPGPCDIAWDVAGAIVEWEMLGQVRERFVGEYEARSGDAVSERLAPYLRAYAIFRLGWCRMAALAMQGEFDEALLERDYQRYRTLAVHLRSRAKAA